MPQKLHPDGADDPRRTDEQFLDLVLADGELLRAAFGAIVQTEWPGEARRRTPTLRPRRKGR